MQMPTRSRMPFRGLVDTFAEMNRIQESWHHPSPRERDRDSRPHRPAWVPTTDIFVRGEDIVIRCELAGVDRSDVELSYAAGTLVIYGERTALPDQPSDDADYYVRERRYGPFSRTINFPEGIDAGRIGATFEDGLLEVTVRGAATAQEVEEIPISDRDEGPVPVEVHEIGAPSPGQTP
jgi:HSP20 family protein